MKYDFDSHTMQYYTSVFMENYPEVAKFVVGETKLIILDETGVSRIKVPFVIRELEYADEKGQIARQAAELVADDAVIFQEVQNFVHNYPMYYIYKDTNKRARIIK